MTAAVAYRSQTAPTRKRSTAPKRTSRPKLRVLDQAAIRRRARRRNAALLLFMVVLSALFLVAFVHARLVESQQELDAMRVQISEMESEKARLERSVDEASAPALIVERAGELGLVRAESPIYLTPVRPAPGDSPVGDEVAQPGILGSTALDGDPPDEANVDGAALGETESG